MLYDTGAEGLAMRNEGNDIGFKGRNIGFEGNDIGFEGKNIGYEGNDFGYEGNDFGYEGNDIGFEGKNIGYEGNGIGYEGNDIGFEERVVFLVSCFLFNWGIGSLGFYHKGHGEGTKGTMKGGVMIGWCMENIKNPTYVAPSWLFRPLPVSSWVLLYCFVIGLFH